MRRNNLAVWLALASAAVAVAGCATTQVDSEWKSPDFAGRTLKQSTVLVICTASDETLRRVCEDQWASQLGNRGAKAVRGYQVAGLPPSGQANPSQIGEAAKKNGATAVVATQLAASDIAVVNPGPQVGVGVGGGSGGGYHGGGFSVGGIGISFPVGGTTATRSLAGSTSVVDVGTNEMIWSGRVTTPASGDVGAQVASLTQVTAEALQKAGLL